jgi:xanthine dehydrogenase large subunit
VSGRAIYVDDLPEPPGTLHVAVGGSAHAHARLARLDVSAVRAAPGVVDVVTHADIPGAADIGPVYPGDLLLAHETVDYMDQPLFGVAALSLEQAQRAVAEARVEYEPRPAVVHLEDALARQDHLLPARQLKLGDADAEIAAAPRRLEGQLRLRGQEHFYLEGQVCLALPTEDDGIHVFSSTQHPSEVQRLVAGVLGLASSQILVEVRRMGGAFGGKETQAAPLACLAALFARRLRRPVKYRMPRKDDMLRTGKRHDFIDRYDAGFDADGRLHGAVFELASMCGCTADLSEGVADRAMFHVDGAYALRHARIESARLRTHTVSNTALRGFGGPQGMIAVEAMLDDIARACGRDPLDVRLANLYDSEHDETPYGQCIEQHVLRPIIERLEASSDYRSRRREISAHNATGSHLRRGLSLVPVKFGISFTARHLNQAGALVHVYTDGSIHLNHGGTEMGQGLFVKVAQIVAEGFGVHPGRVQVSATRTDKVPNTSPTAASAGTDLYGMAALAAVREIRARLIEFAAKRHGVAPEEVRFADDSVFVGEQRLPFEQIASDAFRERVSLSATGFYRTPKIHFDPETGKGRPFLYYAHGAAVSEVIVDVNTGEYRVPRVDILHDVGHSINPAIDIGQIEGGFIQGMG